jgi:tripartite-type tricarboxylate transporter receptor subunit TctC
VPKEAVATMSTALERAHRTTTWKEHAERHLYQDIYLGPAEFSQFLVKRYAEYSEFYEAIGLGATKP